MAEVNKGITISFRGDTIEFDKSLDGINKAMKSLKNDTKVLNKELKFDPTNTEKLAQKMNNLRQQEALAVQKLEMLKSSLKDMGGDASTPQKAKEFEALTKQIGQAEVELESFRHQISKLDTSGVQETSDAFGDASENASMFGDVLSANILSSAVMSGLSTLASMIQSIGSEFVSIVKSGVEYNAQLESYTTSFKAMLGDEQKATELIERLRKNASVSPFDVDALVSSTQALLTTGIAGEKAEKVIMALGDAIAYTGGGNSELKRMASNLQQVKNVGKATAMDIRQFAMAGIDIYGILADSMNTSTESIKDMDISYQDLEKALIKASSEGGKYFGAMERQVDTYAGKLGQLENKWNEFTGNVAEPVNETLKNDIFPLLSQLLDEIAPVFQSLTKQLADFLKNHKDDIVELINKIFEWLTSEDTKLFFTNIFSLFAEIGEFITNLGKLNEKLNVTKTLFDQINTSVVNIKNMMSAVNDLLNGNTTMNNMFRNGIQTGILELMLELAKMGGVGTKDNGMSSGGFASGGITMTNNFTINNANNVTQAQVQQWSSWLAESVNERLGEMI